MEKTRMIEVLGEQPLLLPGLLASALGANDRVKYLLTLIQTARTAADGATGVSDLREERLLFFQDLFASWQVTWEDTRSRNDKTMEGGVYHLASARFAAGDDAERDRFLEALGSRLVFLIDWNKARKRLRRLVSQGTAIKLLRWSVENGYGHMAFLRAGADGLVYEALEFAGGRVTRAGESLQDVLGKPAVEQYMRAVLRICSDGLLGGGSVSLVGDEARAELIGYLRSARQEILALALRHAELSVEIAEGAHDALEQAIAGAADRCRGTARRARNAEHDADALVTEARQAVIRASDLGPFRELVDVAVVATCAGVLTGAGGRTYRDQLVPTLDERRFGGSGTRPAREAT